MPLILEYAVHVLAESPYIVQSLVLSFRILRFDGLWLILNLIPVPSGDDFMFHPLLAVPIDLSPREAAINHKFHGAFLI
jgi:hypothetical protein